LNRTRHFGFASDEFAENTAIFGRKFSAESAMPDTKKSEYVTYKGSKILPLIETNIVSWMKSARNILIFDNLWQYVDPDQAPTIIESAPKDDKTISRQISLARAVLSFLVTADFWLELDDFKLPHQIWTQIAARAN
jgi:hypothetical protein